MYWRYRTLQVIILDAPLDTYTMLKIIGMPSLCASLCGVEELSFLAAWLILNPSVDHSGRSFA